MYKVQTTIERTVEWSCVAMAALVFTLLPTHSFAKTPDGAPPSEETVCDGLQGAAFGLCNAYCEAQDCDVHPRPSCAQLLANFSRITGASSFPCDAVCGDEVVDGNEDCDPPGSLCPDEVRTCGMDCTCPEPFCGDGITDPDEECDPAGGSSFCRSCLADCTCAPPPATCCECENDDAGCVDPDNAGACPAGCEPGEAGTVCSEILGNCVVPSPVCCACAGTTCFDGISFDECTAQGCTAAPLGTMCMVNGCQGTTIP
jgi:hypothetical protein